LISLISAGFLERVHAVVDSLDPDLVEALPDVSDRVLLIDVAMHRQAIALAARTREDVLELHRRVSLLVRVQADPDDPIPVR
jgi:hypothetical protein